MFQQYQPCCVRCHMRMAQYISHLTNVPLMECMESQHEPHTSEAMGL